MGTILITSRIGEHYREELEQLMFFNPGQCTAEAGIRSSIEGYGVPEITTDNGCLRIRLNSLLTAQTLFLIDRNPAEHSLAGVLVYIRENIESLSVLHLAVSSQHQQQGRVTSARIIWELLRQVIDTASRVKGINNIKLIYCRSTRRGRTTADKIHVRRAADRTGTALSRNTTVCADESGNCLEYRHANEFSQKARSNQCIPVVDINAAAHKRQPGAVNTLKFHPYDAS